MQIWKSAFSELLICSLIIGTGYAATDELTAPTPPNGMTCFCPGDQITYTCTIVGGTVTVWAGTAFNCTANQIILLHNQISSGTAQDDCNGGSIVGRGVSVNNTGTPCYTSELLVTASSDLNGRTVNCTRDTTLIGSATLQIAGPPLAPANITVTEISQSSFTVTWTPPTNQCGSTLTYQINSTDCGTCTVNTGTPSAFCTNWTPSGQNCTVRVRAVSCGGGLTGAFSDSLTVTLREPYPPAVEDVTIRSKYSQSNGLLSAIEISFPPVEPVQVTPTLTPPITYSVKLSDDLRTLTCTTSVCMIVVTDPPATDVIQVSVIVSNGLGSGQNVTYRTSVPRNVTTSIVDVDVTVTNTSANVTGVLASSFMGSTSLRVDYRFNASDELNAISAMTGSSGDTLTVMLTSLQVGVPYNYSVFVIHEGLMVEVCGTFSSSCLLEDLVGNPSSTNPDSVSPVICTSNSFSNGITLSNRIVCYTGKNPGSQPPDNSLTFCNEGYELNSGSPIVRTCQKDGTWSGSPAQCVTKVSTVPVGAIIAIVIVVVLLVAAGVVSGIVLCWWWCKKRAMKDGDKPNHPKDVEVVELTSNSPSTVEHKSTPPTGGEYDMVGLVGTTVDAYEDVEAHRKPPGNKRQAKMTKDPKPKETSHPTEIIVHETTPTGELYAVVDKRASKKKTGDPPPPGSIYQDPNTIEHETTDTGDMYAVVDKPKRKSKKQVGAPDVVPDNKSSDLMYADIDVAKVNRKNPRAQIPHQAHPGTVGGVEYATINTNI